MHDPFLKKNETEMVAKGVVVIVHGAMEHQGRYSWLAGKWNVIGYHVVMGDLVGQGENAGDKPGHIDSFNQYIQQVRGWIAEADRYKLPIYLLGHSMGGLIIIRVIEESQLPIAGVILSSPCLALIHKPSTVLDLISRVINHIKPDLRIESGIAPELATRNQAVIEADQKDDLYISKVSVHWFRELSNAMRVAHEQIALFKAVPLLVMQGGNDLVVDKLAVENWFKTCQVQNKQFHLLPGLYHEIFNEPEREDVFKKAAAFVESIEKH